MFPGPVLEISLSLSLSLSRAVYRPYACFLSNYPLVVGPPFGGRKGRSARAFVYGIASIEGHFSWANAAGSGKFIIRRERKRGECA
jgi:hypothetical protein